MSNLQATDEQTQAVWVAYSDSAYSKAMVLARQVPDSPEVKLVYALCLIYNKHNQNIADGVRRLGELYKDKTTPQSVWRVAALAYARVIQTLRSRPEVYSGIAAKVDIDTVFKQIILRHPASREACSALLFLSLKSFASGDKRKIAATFMQIRKFCTDYQGEPRVLVPILLFTESKFITINHDYQSAVEFLIKAYDAKIANSKNEEVVLFRIGRIYDRKLANRVKAIFYYKLFLKRYPESGFAPTIKRFLSILEKAPSTVITGSDKDE